jgi:hypothetical protein
MTGVVVESSMLETTIPFPVQASFNVQQTRPYTRYAPAARSRYDQDQYVGFGSQ